MSNLPGRVDRLTKRIAPPESPFVINLWTAVRDLPGIVENKATGERMSQEALRRLPGWCTINIGDTELKL